MLRRHRLFFICLAVLFVSTSFARADVFHMGSGLTSLELVTVGNSGNAPDSRYNGISVGSVDHVYQIGKYDVTVGQYTEFLNAVAATDTYSLYNPLMATDLRVAGIARSGVSGSYSYSVINSPNHPITYVSWGDAARFSNWLHNGQPTGAEGPATTETGAYTLNGVVADTALNAVSRSAGAKWFIPTESEWYKAAYYDAPAGHYWNYATGTDTTPMSASPGSTQNSANYYDFGTGYAVTQTTSYDINQNYLTDVGAYTASPSSYGTFDQSGNVWQWNEALIGGSARVLRGGSWDYFSLVLAASRRYDVYSFPTDVVIFTGFRVATVPEPSTVVLAIFGCVAIWRWRSCSSA